MKSRNRQRTTPSPRWTRERVELDIGALLIAGDEAGAASAVLRVHGAEVFGFLLGVLDRGKAARDAYAGVAERIRQGLARFRWRCSLRTWIYGLAREELERYAGAPDAAAAGGSPSPITLPDPTTTVPCRRTGLGAAVAALRGRLPVEDRALLILRVDRRLSLSELALIALGEGASTPDLAREADRIRARLHRIRDELGRAAVEQRILDPRGIS